MNFVQAYGNSDKDRRVLNETSLMFLVHPTLAKSEVDKTCRVIHEVVKAAAEN
jgi:hypothetical protein